MSPPKSSSVLGSIHGVSIVANNQAGQATQIGARRLVRRLLRSYHFGGALAQGTRESKKVGLRSSMKSIRISDGLVVDLQFICDNPGEYVNYWGPKEPGECDVPPRGDRWGHAIEPELVATGGRAEARTVPPGCG